MELAILPLAITTMLGPQLLSSIIFVTSEENAVRVSLGYLAGILGASTVFIVAVFTVARLFGLSAKPAGQPPSWANGVEIVLVALLILLAVRSYLTRKTAKPPKWLSSLQTAGPGDAFKLGLLLIFLMPTDILVMITVGMHLATHGSQASDLLNAIPFLAVVMLLAGLPLLGYLTFRAKAVVAMPKLRDWMQANSWLVNIIIYLFFIVLITT